MYFIRHSERLDQVSPQVWKDSPRYKENKWDTPLSPNGYKIAEKTILDILENDKREIGEIYSSPADRCIQTALEFQKQVFKTKGILVPIKIENGLIFDFYNVENYIKKFEKRGIIFGENTKKFTFVDDYMKPKNIAKRYGEQNFDNDYKPIISIKKINAKNNPQTQFNMRLNTVFDICDRVDLNKLNISVTHQEIIADTICPFYLKIKYFNEIDKFREKYFATNDYCFWITVDVEKDKMDILSLKNKDGVHPINKKFIESLHQKT